MSALTCSLHQSNNHLARAINKPFSSSSANLRVSHSRKRSLSLVKQWYGMSQATLQVRCTQHSIARRKTEAHTQTAANIADNCSNTLKVSRQIAVHCFGMLWPRGRSIFALPLLLCQSQSVCSPLENLLCFHYCLNQLACITFQASLSHLILPAALLLGSGGVAHAAGAESVASLVSSAVPAPVSSAVSSTFAPVAETTAAFIPGI